MPAPRGPRFDTLAVVGGYDHDEALTHHGAICEPAYVTPAQHYATSAAMRDALRGEAPGWTYTRIDNPTVAHLEAAIARLDGYGCDAPVTTTAFSSGMAAIFMTVDALLAEDPGKPPPNVVLPAACYGGTYMLFSQRIGIDRGVEVRWIANSLDLQQWADAIDAGTRLVFCEVPSNPHLRMTDIPALATLAHARGAPLAVDATVPSPALLRPLAMGADIVVHSVSKSMSASGMSIAGAVSSRAGIVCEHRRREMSADFAGWLKRGPRRDTGVVLSPFNAFATLADLRGLRARMEITSRSAARVARALQAHPFVEEVLYPGLERDPGHAIAVRDLVLVDSELDHGAPQNAFGYLLSLRPRGGAAGACAFLDALRLVWRANDLGRMKSIATIPAIATHSQLTDAEKAAAHVPPDLVRLSVGCEHVDDILADLEQALEAAQAVAS
ncbi:PLP-dependent aspartate aminotransferase family protein [Salinarimonas sp.]|uniref:trans-sulfuration enzyme family protein n=1 Tax=Salinarimonas sp. TaxID=2766526 RepID=UPI0032D98C5C